MLVGPNKDPAVENATADQRFVRGADLDITVVAHRLGIVTEGEVKDTWVEGIAKPKIKLPARSGVWPEDHRQRLSFERRVLHLPVDIGKIACRFVQLDVRCVARACIESVELVVD